MFASELLVWLDRDHSFEAFYGLALAALMRCDDPKVVPSINIVLIHGDPLKKQNLRFTQATRCQQLAEITRSWTRKDS